MSDKNNSNKKVKMPKILLNTFIILFVGSAALMVLYPHMYSTNGPIDYEGEVGKHIELQNDEKYGEIISLNGKSKIVDIHTILEIKSAKIRVEKYYTNDLLIEDGEGKASVDISSKETLVKTIDKKGQIHLDNNNNKDRSIIVIEPMEVEHGWIKELPLYGFGLSLIFLFLMTMFYVFIRDGS